MNHNVPGQQGNQHLTHRVHKPNTTNNGLALNGNHHKHNPNGNNPNNVGPNKNPKNNGNGNGNNSNKNGPDKNKNNNNGNGNGNGNNPNNNGNKNNNNNGNGNGKNGGGKGTKVIIDPSIVIAGGGGGGYPVGGGGYAPGYVTGGPAYVGGYQGNSVTTNYPPVNGGAPAVIRIVNPATSAGAVNYQVNGYEYTIEPGQAQTLTADRTWTIGFNRGPDLGDAEYSLTSGDYKFGVDNDDGWNLYASNDE
jgi:hypothetical protein